MAPVPKSRNKIKVNAHRLAFIKMVGIDLCQTMRKKRQKNCRKMGKKKVLLFYYQIVLFGYLIRRNTDPVSPPAEIVCSTCENSG